MSLPDAFAYEIGADDTWVKVPREHVERVQQFIDLVRGQADAALKQRTTNSARAAAP